VALVFLLMTLPYMVLERLNDIDHPTIGSKISPAVAIAE
jgi:hypothetical protein